MISVCVGEALVYRSLFTTLGPIIFSFSASFDVLFELLCYFLVSDLQYFAIFCFFVVYPKSMISSDP